MEDKIIQDLVADLSEGKVNLYTSKFGTMVTITDVKNHKIYYGNNAYRISDFCVTYRHYKKRGWCTTNQLRKKFPEIYGENATPCNATLFVMLIKKYQSGSTLTGKGVKLSPYKIYY